MNKIRYNIYNEKHDLVQKTEFENIILNFFSLTEISKPNTNTNNNYID